MVTDNVEARLNSSLDSLIEQSKKAKGGLGGRVSGIAHGAAYLRPSCISLSVQQHPVLKSVPL